jgi:tetratricopeptide (TPR) repeat protein
MKAAVLVVLVCAATSAYADPERKPPPGTVVMKEIREMFERGDYEGAKRELLRLYELVPDAEFLFALGQAELNLGNYEAAIRYYEKFLESNPTPEQAALAQQAIGAARLKLAEKPDKPDKPDDPPPPPPPPERPPAERGWTLTNTGLLAFGGAAVVLGTGLMIYSRSLANDHSGTLSAYNSRLDQARSTRLTGGGILAAGTLLIGVAFLW